MHRFNLALRGNEYKSVKLENSILPLPCMYIHKTPNAQYQKGDVERGGSKSIARKKWVIHKRGRSHKSWLLVWGIDFFKFSFFFFQAGRAGAGVNWGPNLIHSGGVSSGAFAVYRCESCPSVFFKCRYYIGIIILFSSQMQLRQTVGTSRWFLHNENKLTHFAHPYNKENFQMH